MEREQQPVRVSVDHPLCPFCKDAVRSGDPKVACDSCMGWHHAECWGEGGDRCSSCGLDVLSGSPQALSRPVATKPVVQARSITSPSEPVSSSVLFTMFMFAPIIGTLILIALIALLS
jgi:hypothetical protein